MELAIIELAVETIYAGNLYKCPFLERFFRRFFFFCIETRNGKKKIISQIIPAFGFLFSVGKNFEEKPSRIRRNNQGKIFFMPPIFRRLVFCPFHPITRKISETKKERIPKLTNHIHVCAFRGTCVRYHTTSFVSATPEGREA